MQHAHVGKTRQNGAFVNPAGPVVVKVGGAALDGPSESAMVAQAIAALHRVWPSGVVVVHGGGTEVDRHLGKLGLVSEKREGIRITPRQHIDEIVAVLAGKVNKRLMGQIQQQGVPAVGLCLGDGFLMRTVKAAHYLFEPGEVGQAAGGDPRVLQTLLPAGFLPVLCSIGLDGTGNPLNINADEAACDLARLLGASNLVFLTDVPGVLDSAGNLIEELTPDEVEKFIECGTIHGGMIPKVRSALASAQAARIPATIATWRDPASLSALGDGRVCGTCIHPSNESAASSNANIADSTAQAAPPKGTSP